jgi:hypothetical protein
MTTTPPESDLIVRPTRTIELDFAKFTKLAIGYGWMANGGFDFDRIAAELGISERQTYRVLGRESRPGANFIGGLLTAAEEVGFRRLFKIVNASDPIGRD